MKLHDIYSEYKRPIVLALGFFDCVHTGHKSIIDEVFALSRHFGAESAVFSFSNDPNVLLCKAPQVYSFEDRAEAFTTLGVENIVHADFSDEFSKLNAVEFLDLLSKNFNIRAFVAGKDHRFGAGAEGDAELLVSYANDKNIAVKIIEFTKSFDVKVSTTALKKLIASGDVSALNALLTEPYFMRGNVIHGCRRGAAMNFPTANISVPDNRFPLAEGVYITGIFIDGILYDGITNVGEKPTFGDSSPSVETYIFDFSDSIYGKTIKIQFLKRLRGVIKFNSADELKKRMYSDQEIAKQFFANSREAEN